MTNTKGAAILDALMSQRREWATTCVYCARTIVNTRLMPSVFSPQLIGGDLDKVDFTINGHRHRALRATADHYFDRAYGGHSTLNNILPACRPCNGTRSTGRDAPKCIDCRAAGRLYGPRCPTCHRTFTLHQAEVGDLARQCSNIINKLFTT